MAKKDEFIFPQERCDICGATLEGNIVVQEFPDGSLAKLCPECAAGADLGGDPQSDEDFGDDDATAEWTEPEDHQPTAADLFAEPGVRKGKSTAPTAKPTKTDAPRFQAEIFEPEIFDAELAGAEVEAQAIGPEAAAKAEAELAAWAQGELAEGELPEEDAEAGAPAEAEEEAAEAVDLEVESRGRGAELFDAQPATGEPPALETTAEMDFERGLEEADEGETAALEAQAEPAALEAQAEPAALEVEPADGELAAETEPAVVEVAAAAETAAIEAEVEIDAIDKTRELLMPVTDLISLQSEMQSALARLASSLERFAVEMVASEDKTTLVNSRLQMLERELEVTRTRLHETESLLPNGAHPETAPASAAGSVGVRAAAAFTPPPLPLPTMAVPPLPTGAAPMAPPPLPLPTMATPPLPTSAVAVSPPPLPTAAAFTPPSLPLPTMAVPPLPTGAVAAYPPSLPTGAVAVTPPSLPAQTAVPVPGSPATPTTLAHKFLRGRKAHQTPAPQPEPEPQPAHTAPTFTIPEVQVAQRYYNDSPFIQKIRDISRSIGRPKANLTHASGGKPQAIITVFWDIVWYQFLVDLRRDLSSGEERVVLDREGMDLEELGPRFREKNATVNEDGRLDASELEVHLLSDPSALISEMELLPEPKQAVEDATEEIWDQQSAPEFRWD